LSDREIPIGQNPQPYGQGLTLLQKAAVYHVAPSVKLRRAKENSTTETQSTQSNNFFDMSGDADISKSLEAALHMICAQRIHICQLGLGRAMRSICIEIVFYSPAGLGSFCPSSSPLRGVSSPSWRPMGKKRKYPLCLERICLRQIKRVVNK